jgi:hypothetical protein
MADIGFEIASVFKERWQTFFTLKNGDNLKPNNSNFFFP